MLWNGEQDFKTKTSCLLAEKFKKEEKKYKQDKVGSQILRSVLLTVLNRYCSAGSTLAVTVDN